MIAIVRPFGALSGALLLLAGCAQKAEEVETQFVSPEIFADFDCARIERQFTRVSTRLSDVSERQDTAASIDAQNMALSILVGPRQNNVQPFGHYVSVKLARLKGEYEALTTAAADQGCVIETVAVDEFDQIENAPVVVE